jgi:hypothetical protein
VSDTEFALNSTVASRSVPGLTRDNAPEREALANRLWSG